MSTWVVVVFLLIVKLFTLIVMRDCNINVRVSAIMGESSALFYK